MSLTNAARVTAATMLLCSGAALIGASPAAAVAVDFPCDVLTRTKDPKLAKLMQQVQKDVAPSGTVGITCFGPDGEYDGQEMPVYNRKTGNLALICTHADNNLNGLVATFTGCKVAGTQQRRAKRLLRLR